MSDKFCDVIATWNNRTFRDCGDLSSGDFAIRNHVFVYQLDSVIILAYPTSFLIRKTERRTSETKYKVFAIPVSCQYIVSVCYSPEPLLMLNLTTTCVERYHHECNMLYRALFINQHHMKNMYYVRLTNTLVAQYGYNV